MIEYQADTLASKIKHYLITTMGRTADEANDEEFYRAFSFSLREEIMINWLATTRSYNEQSTRKLYYLSMEYLPGRFMSSNVTNLCASELVQTVMGKLGRNLTTINFYESDPALGNGGLGRLASCFLDSLATKGYPATAYGLRYQYGIFEQHIVDGKQVEAPDCWLLNENPWEFRRDMRRQTVKFCGTRIPKINIHGDEVSELLDCEEVWALPYDIPIIGYNKDNHFSVVTLRLWSTKESPRNFQLQKYNAGRLDQAAENTTLTDVLYPADFHDTGKRIRLKQEFLLVSASLQDIIRHYKGHFKDFRSFSDVVRIQINDTHPSLVIPELIRLLTKEHGVPWSEALAITRQCTGYTNHTILSEALEQWDQGLMRYLLPRQYHIIERLNWEFCDEVRIRFPNDEDKVRRMSIIQDGKVHMAPLAIVGSHDTHGVNGVAKLHSDILKNLVFKDFADMFPNKFTNVTNGVTQRRWLLNCNPELSQFITQRIGDKWITDFSEIKKLGAYADDEESQKEFLQIKISNKNRLANYLKKNGEIQFLPTFNPEALFDVQIKRFHEYKRQLLNCLHILMTYNEILENPQHARAKRLCIFAGKAAASYDAAKRIIQLIHCIIRVVNNDSRTKNFLQVVFVPNYNVSLAEMIIPATDLSEQISTAGLEASGTGNMKFSMNGALTIGTQDGANIEMKQEVTEAWWPFTFGATAEEIATMKKNHSYNPWDIYHRNPQIQKAVEMLHDHSLANNDTEHQALSQIYNSLMQGSPADFYFVLYDLESYYKTQKNVDNLFNNEKNWVRHAIHNIAGMGKFSTDRSIDEYAEKIWGITPAPLDEKILDKIRQEYSEHDKCRIY